MLTKSRKPVGAAEALPQILCTYLTILKEQTAHVIYDAPQQERHTYIEHGKNRGPFDRVDLAEGGRYTCSTGHVEREREDESKGLGAVIESERASPKVSRHNSRARCCGDQRRIRRSDADEKR